MTLNRAGSPRKTEPRSSIGPYTRLAFFGLGAAFLILGIRLLHLTHRITTFSCYLDAGLRWRDGGPIYNNGEGMGFVYSPLIAAYFAAYTFLPVWMGKMVWLLTNEGLLAWGTYAVIREGVFRIASDRARALVLILLLPFSMASLDVAQSNSALIGLMLIAVALAARERWTLCVIALALAVYLKIYPLVLGLVLCVYAPGKVTWRLALALLSLGALSLVLQHPHYVLTQYHEWFATRAADDRRLNSAAHAPLDLWFLIVRLGHLPISERAYVALQVLSGGAIAGFALLTRGWAPGRRLAGIYLLCSSWIILLGPATESYTYAILAPAVSLALVAAFSGPAPPLTRMLAALAAGMMLAAQFKNIFFASWHSVSYNAMRPMGALILTCAVILWLREDAMWEASDSGPGCVPSA